MDHDDHEQSGLPEVTVRCAQDPGLVIRMLDRHFIDGDETVFTFDASADGLHARVRDVTVTNWDRDGDLAAFLQGLADDFRGWPGQRTWQTSQLDLQAVHHSGGHVELTWTLRPWSSQQAPWETSITTWAEAGQQLTNLAADVHAFLARP